METQEVIEWLNSDQGLRWAYRRFDNPNEYHEIIEVIDDCPDEDSWSDAYSMSTPGRFRRIKQKEPEWRDLQWTPDRPPEGGI